MFEVHTVQVNESLTFSPKNQTPPTDTWASLAELPWPRKPLLQTGSSGAQQQCRTSLRETTDRDTSHSPIVKRNSLNIKGNMLN